MKTIAIATLVTVLGLFATNVDARAADIIDQYQSALKKVTTIVESGRSDAKVMADVQYVLKSFLLQERNLDTLATTLAKEGRGNVFVEVWAGLKRIEAAAQRGEGADRRSIRGDASDLLRVL